MVKEEELRAQVEQDPADPAFAELAELLRGRGSLEEALLVLLRGLSAHGGHARGRLILARVFYQLGLFPFAIRELEELHRALPENRSVEKLLQKLSPGAPPIDEIEADEETIAESEFDIADLDVLDVEE